MKRMALGAVVGLAAWFGSALAAEAQQIVPTGPMAIYTGNMSATYTADTIIPYLLGFSVQVSVFRGNNPNPCYVGEVFVPNPTSLTTSISIAANWNPGAMTGEKLKFRASLIFNGICIPALEKVVTVTRPTTYLESSGFWDLALEAVDRDRRHEA